MNRKKAQEEITGFVIIVVLVIIILLVLLVLFSNKPSIKKESQDIYQFMESALQVTSDCAINYEPKYSDFGNLIKNCRDGKICTSGKESCEVLESDFSKILSQNWNIGDNSPYSGYEFLAEYSSNFSISPEKIINIFEGNCSSSFKSASGFISSYPGKIEYSLKICFKS